MSQEQLGLNWDSECTNKSSSQDFKFGGQNLFLTNDVIKRSICIIQMFEISQCQLCTNNPCSHHIFNLTWHAAQRLFTTSMQIPVACHIDTPDVMLMLLAVVKSEQPNSRCHCQCQNLHPIISILRLVFLQNFPSFASDAPTKVTLSIFKCCLFQVLNWLGLQCTMSQVSAIMSVSPSHDNKHKKSPGD